MRKRKDVMKQKKPRPSGQRVLSPFGMMEIMKQRNPKEFAEALRNLKKTCGVCDATYFGNGHTSPEVKGVICEDCWDCFAGQEINEKSIATVKAYRHYNPKTKTDKFVEKYVR